MAYSIWMDGSDKFGGTISHYGSGFQIGDGVRLTAGHVVFEFNEESQVSLRNIVHVGTVLSDPRGFESKYRTARRLTFRLFPIIPAFMVVLVSKLSLGNQVLGQIFGSKEVSREVAADASTKTGIDPSLLKKMLPIVAGLVASYYISHRGGDAAPAGAAPNEGKDGGLLGTILGGLTGR